MSLGSVGYCFGHLSLILLVKEKNSRGMVPCMVFEGVSAFF